MALPSSIDTAFCRQYGSQIYVLAQQTKSKFAPWVRKESVVGASAKSFDRLGETEGEDMTTRHGPTPNYEFPHTRRWVQPVFHHTSSLIDDTDKLQTLIDPQNAYAQGQAAYFGRWIDDKIIAAALGDAAAGVMPTTSTIAFKDESISINGDGTATTLGTLAAVTTIVDITLAKMALMGRIFDEEDVDPEEPRYWACTPKDVEDLLQLTQVGSADYNTVKVLQTGKMSFFMGFNWLVSNRLTKDAVGSTGYRNFAFMRDGIILGRHEEMFTRITEESTLSYSTRVYARTSGGAVRMDGAKVHECLNKVA